jgi:Tol biopolymer transport system component
MSATSTAKRFMALAAGARLGPYEILSPLGAGGMGEVYRARDTKLGRDVAIKILPRAFTADPERLARFEREARVLASLNHPNIGSIYGLEEGEGVRALVLELVEGETLAERIATRSRSAPGPKGPGLPVTEALAIARQIADALDAAHEKAIIHRDLKPANIQITPDGIVKVLDFGLAKSGASDGARDLSQSPTVTVGGTHEGVILGTTAYMSPEQARGQAVDKRTDIWAFGCVLFDMLTGRAAFSGKTVSDTIAAILERQPDWSALPASTPPNVRHLLAHCLEKDPKRRRRDIGDVRVELDDAEGPRPPRDAVERIASRGPERAAWAALVLVTAAAATLVTPTFRRAPAAAEVRFDVSFPPGMSADFAQLAISPDGQQLVAAPTFGGRAPLWVRFLGSTSGRTLPGTEGAFFPFWSPDGKSIGFFADQKLKRIDVDGEAIEIVTDVQQPRGGAWQTDGTILFAPNATGPLFRVPATGGQPTIATHLEKGQNDHRAPFILPDGRHFLYYARGTPQARGVYVARLDGSESRRLLDADAQAVYAASGHLLFVRQGDLLAQPFDAPRLALNGVAFRLSGQVAVNPRLSLASLSTSAAGAIAYGTGSIRRTQFTWVDRSGKRLETVGAPDKTPLANPALSPDGREVAFSSVGGGNEDIWLMNMHGAMSRFTSDPAPDSNPIWSSDGRQILFNSYRNGSVGIYSQSIGGGALEQVLLGSWEPQEYKYPSDVSTDSRFLLYTKSTGPAFDLWYVPLVGDRTPHPFVQTTFDERDGQFSPDSKWIAYQSNESGHYEIYLKPFPGPGDRIQVSAGGGQQVRWGPRGTELFYVAADQRMTSVPVTFAASGAAALGRPVALFRTEFETTLQVRQQYMVSADGQRFLINAPTDAIDPPSITLILNWKGRP